VGLFGGLSSVKISLRPAIVDFYGGYYNTRGLVWSRQEVMDFNRILVPVAGTEADDEATRLACRFARRTKGKVRAIYVITLKRSLPLDAEIESETRKAEEILARAQSVADEEDYEIETDLLQAREAGPPIVEEAVEYNVDLILMGIKYKRAFGQFSLGSVVPYILENAPCRVILYHQYTAPVSG
jgi:nucleotide-binding universal stress UspA family protein|tara:strand:- start:9586 stop:10137 length:552 start_codon:yes stop_codon:yes gene_type:complete